MQVHINGEQREFGDHPLRLSELVAKLSLAPQRIAIEVNRQIVRRADWEQTEVNEGDKVEIVHFVGGGALEARPLERATSPLVPRRCKVTSHLNKEFSIHVHTSNRVN